VSTSTSTAIAFPAIDANEWRESARSEHEAAAEDEAAFAFVTYEREIDAKMRRQRVIIARCKGQCAPYNPPQSVLALRRRPRRQLMPWNQPIRPARGVPDRGTVGLGAANARGAEATRSRRLSAPRPGQAARLDAGNLGGRGIALIALIAVVLWGFSGFFRVEPDELGVVLRFGPIRARSPAGLNYHLPYPIETALTPQALRVNKIDIGSGSPRTCAAAPPSATCRKKA